MQINQGKKETMYRKTIATAVAGLLILGLGACGNASDAKTADAGSTSQSQTTKKPAEKKPVEQPADLTGTWKQTNSGSTDSWMEAEITARHDHRPVGQRQRRYEEPVLEGLLQCAGQGR